MRAMTDNFSSVETKFLEKCGQDRPELIKVLDMANENGSVEEKCTRENEVENESGTRKKVESEKVKKDANVEEKIEKVLPGVNGTEDDEHLVPENSIEEEESSSGTTNNST